MVLTTVKNFLFVQKIILTYYRKLLHYRENYTKLLEKTTKLNRNVLNYTENY